MKRHYYIELSPDDQYYQGDVRLGTLARMQTFIGSLINNEAVVRREDRYSDSLVGNVPILSGLIVDKSMNEDAFDKYILEYAQDVMDIKQAKPAKVDGQGNFPPNQKPHSLNIIDFLALI
jgi:hypothetical protein